VGRHYDEEVRALGLKGTQYSLLSAVVKLGGPDRPGGPGGATQAALAAALDLDPSTLARNLKPMLDRGWLAVEPGADQRSHRVVATAAGLALRHRAQAGWKRSQLALNARLGEARVARLHALLDECMAALAGEGGAGEGAPREA
jgi:DNA-binding MarR family transcriptional regulator